MAKISGRCKKTKLDVLNYDYKEKFRIKRDYLTEDYRGNPTVDGE